MKDFTATPRFSKDNFDAEMAPHLSQINQQAIEQARLELLLQELTDAVDTMDDELNDLSRNAAQ